MKALLSRDVLELALSHCFDSTEKKAADSFCQFEFKNKALKLTTKGSFTAYEESVAAIKYDSDCVFAVKTSTILEFVKHIVSDEITMVHDAVKNSCLVSSSDKKSKLALQTVELKFEAVVDADDNVFEVPNPGELIAKLNFASHFCSENFQDHPLTAIHCSLKKNEAVIQSTNGPAYYKTQMETKGDGTSEFYLPKKSAAILKNIFEHETLEKISVNKNSIVFKSLNNNLQIFVEKSGEAFPDHVSEWLEKPVGAEMKISTYELSKSLKFFNGIFKDASVQFNVTDEHLELVCQESNLAAKEVVQTETSKGTIESVYNSRLYLECLDALQSSWIDLNFIAIQDSVAMCKMSADDTIILLCPVMS